MPLKAEAFLRGPISVMRRKSIYKIVCADSGHDIAMKVVELWEKEIGSVEDASAGIREFLVIVNKAFLLSTAPIAFASNLTKVMSNPSLTQDDGDPIVHAKKGVQSPGVSSGKDLSRSLGAVDNEPQMSSPTKTLSAVVKALVDALKREDSKGLQLARQEISRNVKLNAASRQWLIGIIGGETSSTGWVVNNAEGRAVIHAFYTNMIQGIGPVRSDQVMKQIIRDIEGTPVDRAYPLRQFL